MNETKGILKENQDIKLGGKNLNFLQKKGRFFLGCTNWVMGVSKNRGTPKSSILIGFSIVNHPFWGTTIFGNTHLFLNVNNLDKPTLPHIIMLQWKNGSDLTNSYIPFK